MRGRKTANTSPTSTSPAAARNARRRFTGNSYPSGTRRIGSALLGRGGGALREQSAPRLGEPVPPAALLDQASCRQMLERTVQKMSEGPPEVRPRQADELGEIVGPTARRVPDGLQQLVF